MSNIPYPKLVQFNDSKWALTQDYYCILPNNNRLTCTKGFTTDLASAGIVGSILIGGKASGNHTRAVWIHDLLYSIEAYNRKICDDIFLVIMKEHGVSWFKRNAMWGAVRLFGDSVWSNHTLESLEYNGRFVNIVR